jgi:DnaJ-class molecular chaperone
MAESPYVTLNVAETADAEEIKKAYRKLARQHHPDLNPGDAAAEANFKRISAAHEILSDDAKRKAYDEFGDASLQSGFDADKAREYTRWQESRQRRTSGFGNAEGTVDFDLSEFFKRQAPGGPRRGRDLHTSIEIDLRQAIEGMELTADLPNHGTVHVRIPRGADSGDTLRARGKGSPGHDGGQAGDLLIEAIVRPHPFVRRQGLDLYLTLPVTLNEAYNGASVSVPTFDGSVVLKIPPGTKQHATLRLRGKGVERKDQRGDMFVEVDVRMPDIADDALGAALTATDKLYTTPIREELAL